MAEPDPLDRYNRQVEEAEGLKAGSQGTGSQAIVNLAGHAPPVVHSFLARGLFATRLFNVTITNVPGPQQPLYMGGSRVRDMMFWVPQTGSIGIGVSILSYNGRVHFGLIADAKLIPDPDAVIRRFGPEFDKLLYLSLMGDWEHSLDADAARRLLA